MRAELSASSVLVRAEWSLSNVTSNSLSEDWKLQSKNGQSLKIDFCLGEQNIF